MTAEDERLRGRPQGGMKSEMGKAAYWRMNYESTIGALADLIAEHTETVEALAAAEAALADVRRYSTMTLDSCSVERQGMATDVLALMDAALRGAS